MSESFLVRSHSELGSISKSETPSTELTAWYQDLAKVKQYLVAKDPVLATVFTTVDASGFALHTVVKDPYTALVGAIIGQKISYQRAKSLRGQLYARYGTAIKDCSTQSDCVTLGTVINPTTLSQADLSFLGTIPAQIITNVTHFILTNKVNLSTEEGIRSLTAVAGIGSWTVETTLLTCLKNWDLFPLNDKFLQTRMQRLYGKGCDMAVISANWAPYRSIVTWYLWRWF